MTATIWAQTDIQDQPADEDGVTQLAQSAEYDETRDIALEEVITTGTRSTRPKTAADSTVRLEVLQGDEFALSGTAELTGHLKTLVPSCNSTPLTGCKNYSKR